MPTDAQNTDEGTTTRRRRRTAPKAPPKEEAPSLTGAEKQMAFRRYASAAYAKLRTKGKVSETAIRQEAYRMYAAAK